MRHMHPVGQWLLRIWLPVLALVLSAATSEARPRPDLILHNGVIFTGNAALPWVQAVAIKGQFIMAVGTDAEITALARPKTKVIDAAGNLVIPGINDAHIHVAPADSFGPLVNPPDFIPNPGPTVAEMLAYVSAAVAQYPAGTWLYGLGGAAFFDDPEATRFGLDEIAPDNPVVISSWNGIQALANTMALDQIGVPEDPPDPFGGWYDRVPGTNTITGMMSRYAWWSFMREMRMQMPLDELRQQYLAMLNGMATFGVTSVQDMSTLTPERMQEALGNIELPTRLRHIPYPMTIEESEGLYAGGFSFNPLRMFNNSGVKWATDGGPIDHGAALSAPYADRPDTAGSLTFPSAAFTQQISDCLRSFNFVQKQCLFHATGDRAVQSILDTMGAVAPDWQWRWHRERIEHGEIMQPEQIAQIAAKGIVLVANPKHVGWPGIFYQLLGPERTAQQVLPLRSLLDAGVKVAFGSDGVGQVNNPFVDIMLAAMHPTRPSQAVTVEEGLVAFTKTAAYAEFMDALKGTIEPGKLADLAVLSQNIFQVPLPALPATVSLLTVTDGRVVYDAGALQ